MKYNRFQLDLTKIPQELRPVIQEKIKDVLEQNGFEKRGLHVVVLKNIPYLILGQFPLSIGWNSVPYSNPNYKDVIIYDAISDWDIWTKIPAIKEFKPINLALDPLTTVIVDKTSVNINGVVVINFDKFDKIVYAVRQARDFNKED